MTSATARWINNGSRLHLQHGPIDLIISADGKDTETAYSAAVDRFNPLLQELVDELSLLQQPCSELTVYPHGSVAHRMVTAARQVNRCGVTSMIAVAGSVADEILASMLAVARLTRVSVNNGGDIAIHLSPGQSYRVGIVSDPRTPDLAASVMIEAGDGIGGIATSGRHGRSLSGGIADSVTVLASTAARADVAATLIANFVDIPGNNAITRVPANQVDPATDLGAMPVTVDVGHLSAEQIDRALVSGARYARQLIDETFIEAAYLHLRGCSEVVTSARLSENKAHIRLAESLYA